MERTIDLTGVDLVELAKKAYELSVPQRMGFLHYTATRLSEWDAMRCVTNGDRIALSMDYVHGRCIKLHVFREGDKLVMQYPWYDHTDEQLQELLGEFGIHEIRTAVEHAISCNCENCQRRRETKTAI